MTQARGDIKSELDWVNPKISIPTDKKLPPTQTERGGNRPTPAPLQNTARISLETFSLFIHFLRMGTHSMPEKAEVDRMPNFRGSRIPPIYLLNASLFVKLN